MTRIDKSALLEQLRNELQDALEVMLAAARAARAAATHEEMKPENDKDTRGLEAGYLAAGQSARAAELQDALRGLHELSPRDFAADDTIASLALVELLDQDTDEVSWVFVVPHGGGRKLRAGGREILVATARSPLGDALIGKRAGDLVEFAAAGRTRECEVLSVA